jgi:putative protease
MTSTKTQTAYSPELLAPAGGPDALRAAVRNGADAVYLGTAELNARRGAENFTLETLDEACRFAHLRGARVYLTANVLITQQEMGQALEMIAAAWGSGVDAVIVQDLGLMSALHSALPQVRVHASTQVDAHNGESIAAVARLGASRVTLSRELEASEIADLVSTSDIEVECFVHGSLCFCHSGQCLMSSMIGGRSANRGLCAQPCRLPYELIDASGCPVPTPGRHLLSTKDLAGISLLPELVHAGVSSLKIEGRMKSAEYVAAVVSVYRAALDRAVRSPEDFAVLPTEAERLDEAFSRGLTPAYLRGERGNEMMSYSRPNNRGVQIGRVAATGPGTADVSLERSLESADTLQFWTSSGHFAQPAGRMRMGEEVVPAAPSGARVRLEVKRPVRSGDRVFRVANAALLQAARRSWQEGTERLPVSVRLDVRVKVGEPALVEASSSGAAGRAEGPVVEPARTRPVTVEEIIEHVGRLGGTAYGAAEYRVMADADAGIGFSTLHRLRGEAIEKLDAARLAPWSGRGPAVPAPLADLPPAWVRRDPVELVVMARDADSAEACRRGGADRVFAPVVPRTPPPAGVGPWLPRIAHGDEVPALLAGAAGDKSAVCGNLGLLAAAAASGLRVEADWGLNALNDQTVAALARLGAERVWASPESSGRSLQALCSSSPVPIGVVVGGRFELMVAEHCVIRAIGPCAGECGDCLRRARSWTLRDRKGYRFPVATDPAGRAHIYNSVPLDLARGLRELLDDGVSSIRLDLASETADRSVELTKLWRGALDRAACGEEIEAPIERTSSSGHFFRALR